MRGQPVQVPQDLGPRARKRQQRGSRSPARKAQSFLQNFFKIEKMCHMCLRGFLICETIKEVCWCFGDVRECNVVNEKFQVIPVTCVQSGIPKTPWETIWINEQLFLKVGIWIN